MEMKHLLNYLMLNCFYPKLCLMYSADQKKIKFSKISKKKIKKQQTDDKFFWPGGCGGGPRFVFKFASVAITCWDGCCFCLFNVNFFVNSALKSSGPAPLLFEKLFCCGGESFWCWFCSAGGERFVVILPAAKTIKI